MIQTTVEQLSEWMGLKKPLVAKIIKLGIELGEIKEVGTSEVALKGKTVAVYQVPDELKFSFLPPRQEVVEEVLEVAQEEVVATAQPQEELSIEEPVLESVPKKFILRCVKCRWARTSTGISSDLQDLKETTSCTNCGKPRQFRCPRCGQTAKLTRIRNVS